MQVNLTPLKIARFCNQTDQWQFYENRHDAIHSEQYDPSWKMSLQQTLPDYSTGSGGDNHVKGLKIGTFNVLFDLVPFFIKPILRSRQRWRYTVEMLKRENFDILVLNEVTSRFLFFLQEEPFFKDNYFFSDIFEFPSEKLKTLDTVNHSLGSRMGNLIISKFAPNQMFMESNAIPSRPAIYAMFSQTATSNPQHSDLSIVAVHTSAMTNNHEKRRKELLTLSSAPILHGIRDVIMMGDLNLHDEKEDVIIEEMGFRDMWTQTRQDMNKGYTFDSVRNTMVRVMFYGMEIRRMRLDRMLVKSDSLWTSRKKVKIFADRPLCELVPDERLGVPWWWKAFSIFFGDYLFCSDHFGLQTRLVQCETPEKQDQLLSSIREKWDQETEGGPSSNHRLVLLSVLGVSVVVIFLFSLLIGYFLE